MTEIWQLGAAELSGKLRDRSLSVREVMEETLARIEAVNGPVNAVVSLRDPADVLAEADAADRAGPGGPLFGMPLAIKDLADTEGVRTTYGSPLFADHVPSGDCGMVARMKAAGGIVIGKTNTPEFGLGSHSYNPVHGVTRNPYDTGVSAGGSSGGAAAALAARMVPLADGSDMMGSLRNPAGWNNVYGFRPSWGRVPADPAGDSYLGQLSTSGPMARTVEDLVLLLRVQEHRDPRLPGPDWPLLGKVEARARGLRIGWLGDWGGAFPMEPGVLAQAEAGLADLSALGAEVEAIAPPHPAGAIWEAWTTLRSFSVAAELAPLLLDPEKRDHLKPELIWEIERGQGFDAMAVHRASALRSAWLRDAVTLFERFDLLALPTAQCFAFPAEWHWPKEIAGQTMDTYHRWMEVVLPAGLLGLPTLAVPAGFNEGRSMGLQLIGPPGADETVLSLGMAYHDATDWPGRVPPPV